MQVIAIQLAVTCSYIQTQNIQSKCKALLCWCLHTFWTGILYVNTVSGLMLQHIWCIHFSQLSHEICKIMLTKCIEPACSYYLYVYSQLQSYTVIQLAYKLYNYPLTQLAYSDCMHNASLICSTMDAPFTHINYMYYNNNQTN